MDKLYSLYKKLNLWNKSHSFVLFAKRGSAEFLEFLAFFFFYLKKKILTFSHFFERNKNILVKFFMMKRGRYNRPFLHFAAMAVLGIGVIIGPFIAESFPIFLTQSASLSKLVFSDANSQSIVVGENVFQTNISQKPRDTTITYAVEKGDTLSTIAKKFDISVDTIKWENDLSVDDIAIGDEIKILPVSGLSHKVVKGETVYSIAKKFDTEAQKIVDFPFNEFANPETFSLVEGQLILVPDAIKPSQQSFIKRDVFIVQGPVAITDAGFTWPVHGLLTQFATWYHMGIDIAAPIGTPIVAAQSGRVSMASSGTWDGGYGTSVWVDNGAGFASHYAHMSGLNVTAGDEVIAGKTVVGWIGMTGRTTGPHIHFEIRRSGVLVNPLPFLQ